MEKILSLKSKYKNKFCWYNREICGRIRISEWAKYPIFINYGGIEHVDTKTVRRIS